MEQNSRRNQLFLIELIISIFFFIICTTVCIQLFVNAHYLTRKTTDTNHALILSQNIAESFLGYRGDFTQLTSQWAANNDPVSTQNVINTNQILYKLRENTFFLLFYDKNGLSLSSTKNAAYCTTVTHEIKNHVSMITITFYTFENNLTLSQKPVYSVTVEKYIGDDVYE